MVGASPDGICVCRCKHSNCRQTWLVEVKCPYASKYKSPKLAAKFNGCWYDKRTKQWQLDHKHRHYTQAQGLMGVLQYDKVDFVIYTTKGIVVVPIQFNQIFFNEVLSSLEYFQENYLFPYITNTFCVSVKRECRSLAAELSWLDA